MTKLTLLLYDYLKSKGVGVATVIGHLARFMEPGVVCAQEDDWKKEFEEICSRTDNAMSFTKEELKNPIAGCDRLKSDIEKLDESTRKVYLKRLQMCRDFFAFTLESKEAN